MSDHRVRRAAAALLAGLVTLAVTQAVRAHEGHGKASPSPAAPPSTLASAPAEGEAGEPDASSSPESEEAPAQPVVDDPPLEEVPNPLSPFPWKAAFTEHVHNKIIHFPLAFGLAAAISLLAGPRFSAYEPAARALLLGAGLAGIAAFFTGRMQREPFEDGALQQVLSIHQLLGITSTLTLWVGVVLTGRPTARKLWRAYAVLLLLVLSATGFFGGLMSHGSF